MSGLKDPVHVCGFCTLVIQLGYKSLSEDDRERVAAHLRADHGLKPFEIAP